MNSTAPGSNSDSSFVNCAAAARVCAGSAGRRRSCRQRGGWLRAKAARSAIVPAADRARRRPGAMADSVSAAAARSRMSFSNSAGGGLHRLGADVPGHAFERVRQTLGESSVALGQRGGDLLDRRALLLDELAEEFQIELPISRDAGQAVLRVEAVDGREVVARRSCGLTRPSGTLSPTGGEGRGERVLRFVGRRDWWRAAGRGFVESRPRSRTSCRGINRLGDVVVHAGRQATLALLDRGVGGHGDDRQVARSGRRSESSPWPGSRPSPASGGPSTPRRRAAAADRWTGSRPPRVRCWRPCTVAPSPSSKFDRDLLVDLVVLGQQNARAAQPRRLLRSAAPRPRRRRRPAAKTFTSVSTIMDLVTGLTRKPSRSKPLGFLAHFLAPEGGDEHDGRRVLQRLVALDVAAGLQAVHAGHAPVHEHDVVRLGGVVLLDRRRWPPCPDATTSTRLARVLSGSCRISRAAALSSTTSTRSCASRSGTIFPEPLAAPTPSQTVKKKVLPTPGSLSSQTRPPISSTSRRQMVRPKPGAAVLARGGHVGLRERLEQLRRLLLASCRCPCRARRT